MNYIRQLNAFFDFTCRNGLPSIAQVVYHNLLAINNSANWAETFGVTNQRLMLICAITDLKTLVRHRNYLKQARLIEFEAGKKGKPSRYRMVKLYREEEKIGWNKSTQNATENATLNATENAIHNKPKEKGKVKEKKILKEKFEPVAAFVEYAGGDGELLAALEAFAAMRGNMGCPLEEKGLVALLRELDRQAAAGGQKVAMLEQSVLRGYRGVFPVRREARPLPGTESEAVWVKETKKKRPRRGCERCGGEGYFEDKERDRVMECGCWGYYD